MWKSLFVLILTVGMAGNTPHELQAQEKKPQPHDGFYKVLPDEKGKPSLPKTKETWVIPRMEAVPGIAMSQVQKDRFNRMAEKFPIHRAEKDPSAFSMQYRSTSEFGFNSKNPSWEPQLPKRTPIPDATQVAPIRPKEKRPYFFRMLPKASRKSRP